MINEELTFQKFGYYAKDLSQHSMKKIIANCDECNKERETSKDAYRVLCRSCSLKGKKYKKGERFKILTKEFLEEEYLKKKIPIYKIAQELNFDSTTVRKRLIEFGIPLRSRSEALIGRISPMKDKKYFEVCKKRSHFWKGGITPLGTLIRTCPKNKNWRDQTFKKDNYTCQKCGARSGDGKAVYLEAHHKEAFSNIFQKFLQEYNQFSPIEDKETLFRLAESYPFFWDVANGQTLCYDCHYLVENCKGEQNAINKL